MGQLLAEGHSKQPNEVTLQVSPALWLAMGHSQTVMPHEEHVDPLCHFMMMCCTPVNRMGYEQILSADRQDMIGNFMEFSKATSMKSGHQGTG